MTPLRLVIASHREQKGWTQDELAAKSGVSRITIARIESGKTTRVDFEVIERLAAALDVEPPGLLLQRVRAATKPPKKRGRE
jgi:transcriptional regulator with XRE-family HTH domain